MLREYKVKRKHFHFNKHKHFHFRIYFLFSLFFLLFFSSACINQTDSIKLKQKCIDLSSDFYPSIPDCLTQNECFTAVNNSFFKSQNFLPENIKARVFVLKNSVARSWLYFNLSRNELKKIHSSCIEEDFSSLNKHLNNAKHYLSFAFTEADASLKLQLEILLLEKSFLESQEVSLASDSKLFDSFISLNNNINSFVVPDAFNDSFIKKYFSAIDNFNSLIKSKGFNDSIIKEKTPFDLISGFDLVLLKEAKKSYNLDSFFMPLLSKGFHSITSFLIESFKLNGSVKFFSSFPVFDFFNVYSSMMSTDNSVTRKFSVLLSSVSNNYSSLKKSNESFLQEADSNLSLLYADFKDLKYFFNEQEITNILSFNPTGNSQETAFNNSDFFMISNHEKLDIEELFSDAFLKLNELKSNSFSLGRTHAKLTQLKDLLDLIHKNIEILRNKPLSVNKHCIDSMNFISIKLDSLDKKSLSTEKLFLLNSLNEHITEFNKNSSFKENAFHCSEFISDFIKLNSLIKEENDKLKQDSLLKEKILLEESKEASVEFRLLLDNVRKKVLLIRKITSFYPKALTLTEKSFIEQKFSFFDSRDSNFLTILTDLNTFNDYLDSKLKESLVFYFSNSAKLTNITPNSVVGSDFNSVFLLEFFNPFNDFNFSFSFSFPLKFSPQRISFVSSNISLAVIHENSVFLSFEGMPFGKSFVKFYSNIFIPFTETTDVLKASENSALMHKLIKVQSETTLTNAFFSIPRPFNSIILNVYFNEQPVVFTENNDSITFTLKNVFNSSLIEIVYSLSNPFNSSFECSNTFSDSLDSSNSLSSLNDFTLIKNCKVTLNSDYFISLKKIQLVLPFNKKNILDLSLHSFNSDISFNWLSDNLILLYLPENTVFPFSFNASFSLIDSFSVVSELKLLQKELASFNSDFLSSEDKAKLSSLLNETNNLLLSDFNSLSINDMALLTKNIQRIKKEENSLKENLMVSSVLIERIQLAHSAIQNKLKDINKSLSFDNLDSDYIDKLLTARKEITTLNEKSIYFFDKNLKTSLSYAEKALNYPLPVTPSFSTIKNSLLNRISLMKKQLFILNNSSPALKNSLDSIEKTILSSQLNLNFKEISTQLNDINSNIQKIIKSNALSLKDDIDFIFSSLEDNSLIFRDLEFLSNELSSVPEEKIISIHYNPSFSVDDLKEFNYKLNSLLTSKEKDDLQEAIELIKKQEFYKALLQVNLSKVNEKKKFILLVKEKLFSWKNHLKSDAKTLLSNSEKSKALTDASVLFKKKHYLQAIVLLSGKKEASTPSNYFFLIPFVLIALLLLVFNPRKKEETKPTKKILLPKLN